MTYSNTYTDFVPGNEISICIAMSPLKLRTIPRCTKGKITFASSMVLPLVCYSPLNSDRKMFHKSTGRIMQKSLLNTTKNE